MSESIDFTKKELLEQCIAETNKIVKGQDDLIRGIMASLVCEGHLLIEGLPGLGKTLSVVTLSKICQLNFNRVQFTPDLLPSDLIGTLVYNQGTGEFSTKFGPIFTQILLTDEINRSPPKVQSSLLEAMAERQVTIGDESFKLSSPFVVLATQNPIEQEGTYPLPEAQLDRFMMKVTVNYPDFQAEKEVLNFEFENLDDIKPILSTDKLLEIQGEVNKVYVDEKIKDLIVRIVHSSRPHNPSFDMEYKSIITAGVSPRATIWLYKLSKFYAFLDRRDFVTPEDIIVIAPAVMGHRLALSYEAKIDNVDPNEIALQLAKSQI